MRIGIPGSGLMGAKLGTIFARAGHEVVFSYSRSNHKLSGWRAMLKATPAPAWRCHD
jgi:predicted dinucleotide-binding enzyme